MVRIPSLSRRTPASSEPEPVTTEPVRDENGDGRIDGRDAVSAPRAGGTTPPEARKPSPPDARKPSTPGGTAPVQGSTMPGGDRATYRSSSAGPATATAPVVDRPRSDVDRDDNTRLDGRPDPRVTDRDRADGPRDRTGKLRDRADEPTTDTERGDRETVVVAPAGPRPRASLFATLSLILGVGSVLFVLAGTLAGYGIALGGLGALLGVAGISATSRRHVAGKSDALLGLVLGLGAVVLGILAMTGQFTWPTTDGDWVLRFREWLDSQFVDRF